MRVKWRTNLIMIHTKKAKQILNSYLYNKKKNHTVPSYVNSCAFASFRVIDSFKPEKTDMTERSLSKSYAIKK